MSHIRKSGQSVKPQSPIGKAATSGMVWLMAQSLSGRVMAFISQLVLAKLLVPEDFGILGLATTISTIFCVFSDGGVEQVLQQRRLRMRFWATQAFWTSLGFASVVAIAMSIYAPIGARIYHDDRITVLVWVIAASLPIWALSTVPNARIKSTMRFKFLASYNTAEFIATQVLTILLAWAHYGAISFVLPGPFLAVIRAVVSWRIAPLPLRPIRVSKGWGIMLKRCATLIGSRISTVLIDQGDYITLGLMATTRVVGMYYFAFKLAAQPMRMIAANFTNVLFPALTAMHDDPVRQRDAALKTAELLGALTVPICFMQAAIAAPGLELLFGTRWSESILFIQILSLGLPFDAIAWPTGVLLDSRGQFHRRMKWLMMSVPFFYGVVITGALLDSAIGVAIAEAAYYSINPQLFTYRVFLKEGGVPFRRLLTVFYAPMFLGLVTIGGAYAVSLLPLFQNRLIAQIGEIVVLGGASYFFAVRWFLPDIYGMARTQLLGLLRK